MTSKLFEIDGLPNFLRYGTPLAGFRRAGAPLLVYLDRKWCKNVLNGRFEPKHETKFASCKEEQSVPIFLSLRQTAGKRD